MLNIIRPIESTIAQRLLFKINSKIINNMDSKYVSLVVLLDYSASFNTIDNIILKNILPFRLCI